MLAIIGTYREDAYVFQLLESLQANTTGISAIHFVDDSGNPEFSKELSNYGHVTETGGQGYNAAMQEVIRIGTEYGEHAAFLEEDFTFVQPVDFLEIGKHIDAHPYLSQVVLQRQPWFEVELRAGDMLRVFKNRGKTFREVHGYLEHGYFFSGNPAVWNKETFASGWPVGNWSEASKRDIELAAGRHFAISPDIRVHHHGIRSGKGY